MATNKVQYGRVIQYTCGAAESYSSGDVVWVGGMPGIALQDIAVTATGSVAMSGVWEVDKHYSATASQGTIFSVGDPVNWDIVNDRACSRAGFPRLGFAIEAAGGDDTTVKVLLSGDRKQTIVKAGEAVDAGELVYVSSIDVYNYTPIVKLSDADASSPANEAVLIIDADIANGEYGLASKAAVLTAVNTSGASAAGDPVYLSDGTAGAWTVTAPSTAGDTVQHVGQVVVKSATVGVVALNLDLGRAVTAPA